MARYELTVVKYGYGIVNAESESEAMSLVGNMKEDDFEWTFSIYPSRRKIRI